VICVQFFSVRTKERDKRGKRESKIDLLKKNFT
jgi:hypothetical protein